MRYVSDARPDIQRKKAGSRFTYTRADGSKLAEKDVLQRIKALAIPLTWGKTAGRQLAFLGRARNTTARLKE